MDFKEIVTSLTSGLLANSDSRKCPDQYVGVIGDLARQDDFKRRDATERPKSKGCLIMILESPHRSEFKDDPGPAKGATGRLIREHVLAVRGMDAFTHHGLILMNAIQHQCSLGFPTSCFRDEVFRAAWESGGRADFLGRLGGYLIRRDDVVVNCCTKGSRTGREGELRALVHDAITGMFPDREALRRCHPASWRGEKNRKCEWAYR